MINYFRPLAYIVCILKFCLVLHGQAPTTQAATTTLLPRESLQLPATLDLELEQLLQRWYEGYEVRGNVPMSLSQSTPVPNVHDSVYIRMMDHIPSGIRLSYNSVVRESIELYLFRRRPLLSSMMSLADLYFPDIEAELDRQGLPIELKYITIVESSLNPMAVSPAGASGLWQFMLPTARIYGLTINSLVDERMDPIRGTEAACRMLKDLYKIYKDWWLVMAAYNCGPGNVNRALARAGGGAKTFWDIYTYLPKETRKYVPLYIGVYFAMYYAQQYGIQPRELGRTLATEFYQVRHEVSFEKIASLTGISVEQIKAFNPQFRRGIVPWNAEPYNLRLPLKAVLKLEGYNPDEIRSHEMSVREEGQQTSTITSSSTNVYHRVGRRETVESIARKYGVTARNIRTWNKLGKRGLKVGQRIIVGVRTSTPQTVAPADTLLQDSAEPTTAKIENPTEAKSISVPTAPTTKPQAPKTHKVRKGDTLHSIAKRYNISLKDLQSLNRLQGNNIQIGQELRVSR